jgi:hypothetical protein
MSPSVAPSFNFRVRRLPTAPITSVATLRGLAPDQALILVNGKRRHVARW